MSKADSSVSVVVKKLSSIRLTVSLLFILAGVSIIGTLIPQDLQQIEYVQRYGFSLYRVFNFFGFFNIYHTWWFNSIIVLLALNLILCTIDRFPGVYRGVKQKRVDMDDAQFSSLPFFKEIRAKGNINQLSEKIIEYFKSSGGHRIVIDNKPYSFLVFQEKGRISRYGPYITHLGIVVVLVGALVGSLFGFRANVNIVEGSSTDRVYDFRRAQEIPLGFEVRCDDFTVEFYPNTQRPKRYASVLSIIENGKVVVQKTIEVNVPLSFRGLTFYQSSYGPASAPSFDVTVYNKKSGEAKNIVLELEKSVRIMDSVMVSVIDYAEDYAGMGPAVLVEINNGNDGVKQFPVFQRFPDLADAHSVGLYKVVLNQILPPRLYYTGLQVTKDPGVNIVWWGSFILTLGLLFSFLLYHRRIWVKVTDRSGRSVLLVGGMSFKNKIGFSREFERMVRDIENMIQEEKT